MKSSFGLLVFYVVLGSCYGLKCYVCEGRRSTGSDCADPFNADGSSVAIEECPSNLGCSTSRTDSGDLFIRECTKQICTTNCETSSEYCTYCCHDDLCNSQSIQKGTYAKFNCYGCVYTDYLTSELPENTGPCGNPFNTSGRDIRVKPCASGVCEVSKLELKTGNQILRGCSDSMLSCRRRCSDNSCKSCCSGNLCNNGPVPGGAQSTTQGVYLANMFGLALLLTLIFLN